MQQKIRTLALVTSAIAAPALSHAAVVQVQVTVRNLAPTNSVSFAPLRVGFNAGTYDAFNNNQTATAPIISIAEGGSGSDWFPAFAAADPTATLGTVSNGGPLLPGATASQTFVVDTTVNPFFTFGAMVVPSNDFFIGNDSPTEYRLFDAAGNLNLTTISQFGDEIWDNGSEVNGAFGSAFLVGSNNSDRVQENGVVRFDFAGLSVFNGLTTAAGYIFNSQLTADLEVYRISFQIVPTPTASALLGLGGLVVARRRRGV